MAVADGLLPSRGYVDGLQGQGDLDELLAVSMGRALGNLLSLLASNIRYQAFATRNNELIIKILKIRF
jgi:hypothetical protein